MMVESARKFESCLPDANDAPYSRQLKSGR